MNIALLSAIVAAVFLAMKMALRYQDPDPKACIQDAGIAFLSGLAGIYAYQQYLDKPIVPKVATVFTERPTF
jgi:hypothetical protein